MSLEWARILFTEAGVGRIVMLTVGKYGQRHTRYELKEDTVLDPFVLGPLTVYDFNTITCWPIEDEMAEGRLGNLIAALMGHG